MLLMGILSEAFPGTIILHVFDLKVPHIDNVFLDDVKKPNGFLN